MRRLGEEVLLFSFIHVQPTSSDGCTARYKSNSNRVTCLAISIGWSWNRPKLHCNHILNMIKLNNIYISLIYIIRYMEHAYFYEVWRSLFLFPTLTVKRSNCSLSLVRCHSMDGAGLAWIISLSVLTLSNCKYIINKFEKKSIRKI